MKFVPGNAQHIGARSEQQDSFGFSDPSDTVFLEHGGFLAVLADGAGGMDHGRAASHLAVKAFLRGYQRKAQREAIVRALQRSLTEANAAVRSLTAEGGDENVATTLVAAVLHESDLYWISVGDSALYRYRAGALSLVNESHVYGRELERDVARGRISAATASAHPDRDALTSYLGKAVLDQVDFSAEPLRVAPGDRVLMATDGLFKTLTGEEIVSALAERNAQRLCELLVAEVLQRGRAQQDNVTVLCVDVEGDLEGSTRRLVENAPAPGRWPAALDRILGQARSFAARALGTGKEKREPGRAAIEKSRRK